MSSGLHAQLALLVMAAYLPFGLIMDALLPRHRAVLVTLLAGFMFLPSVNYDLGGVVHWNRSTAPVLVIGLGMLLRDHSRLSDFRFRIWDLPMVALCLAPGISSLSNGLGWYDAGSAVLYQTLRFAGPYLIGRIHFQTREQLRDLVRIGVLACLIYVPLCLYEFRFSPSLHATLYGVHQHDFIQTIRPIGYRPMVFLQHGLMLAMWLAMSLLLALGLKHSRIPARFPFFSLQTGIVALAVTLLATQSFGAIFLCLLAVICFQLAVRQGARVPLLLLTFLPMVWVTARTTQVVTADTIAGLSSSLSDDRAGSLDYRLRNEDTLAGHVVERPFFGWSSWGRGQTLDVDYDQQTLVLDSLWIITLSSTGWFGLIAVLLVHLVPAMTIFRRAPPATWRQDGDGLLLGCIGIVVTIVMLDNLFNALVNPYFLLLMGAATSLCLNWKARDGAEFGDSEPLVNAGLHDRPRVLGT